VKKWIISALCVLPVAGVLLWFIAGKNIGNMATIGLFLACPLSHIFLMKHNNKEGGGEHHHG
jgi:hypothetical protein